MSVLVSTMLIAVWEKQRWPGLALVSPDVFPPQSSHQMQSSIWLLRISDLGHGLSELHPGLLLGRTRALSILLDSPRQPRIHTELFQWPRPEQQP